MERNTKCLACQKKRQHNETEWKLHHPLSRHGFTKEGGYSDPRVLGAMSQDNHKMHMKSFDPKEPKASKSIP